MTTEEIWINNNRKLLFKSIINWNKVEFVDLAEIIYIPHAVSIIWY